jgi:hypothetical protein
MHVAAAGTVNLIVAGIRGQPDVQKHFLKTLRAFDLHLDAQIIGQGYLDSNHSCQQAETPPLTGMAPHKAEFVFGRLGDGPDAVCTILNSFK